MAITVDKLVRSRRRTIAIIIEKDGTVLVRAPLRMALWRIQEFVQEHEEWVIKHKAKALAARQSSVHHYEEGEQFPFLGKMYPLRIVLRQPANLEFDGKCFKLAKSTLPRAQEVFVAWYKRQARDYLTRQVRSRAEALGFNYERLRISSARTRWGSCSTSGTLSFTYRLMMAPPEVIEYVILHELVHTRIHNHSKNFWNNVARLMPDYKKRLAWLKKNGPTLA